MRRVAAPLLAAALAVGCAVGCAGTETVRVPECAPGTPSAAAAVETACGAADVVVLHRTGGLGGTSQEVRVDLATGGVVATSTRAGRPTRSTGVLPPDERAALRAALAPVDDPRPPGTRTPRRPDGITLRLEYQGRTLLVDSTNRPADLRPALDLLEGLLPRI